MSISIKQEIKDFIYTLHGLAFLFVGLNTGFIIYGVVALDEIYQGNGLELFKLGNLPIPKFLGAGASNIEMFIFCIVGVIAISIGLIRRYLYLRGDIAMMRKLGVKEEDVRLPKEQTISELLDDDF